MKKLNEYKAGLANYAQRIDAAFKSGDEQARFNLENEYRNLSNEYVAYKKFLQDKYPKYKNTSQANKLDLERDKNILPANTAFVDYMIAGKTITAFVFDNNGDIKAVHFNVPENLFEKCNFYRELLAYTPEFVSTFFKKMKQGKSALIAINETKREFLKNTDEMYNDPSVWSAFVLYGF